MARQSRTTVEIPQVPFLDKLFMHVVVSGADGQTAQNPRGDSTGAVLGQVVHARCCVWCRWPDSAEPPWRFHRCRSWTSCSCTLLCLVRMSRQRRTPPWRFHRCRSWTSCSCTLLCLVRMSRQRRTPRGDSTGAVLGQVVHARCCVWCGCPDSAEPPWRFHRCRSWTSCSCTLLCLVRMSRQRRTTVEIPQVPFLDKLFMHVVVSGADGQTAQNPVEIPQVPFLDKLFMHVVVSGADGQTAQNHRGDSTGAVLGQVVHARCCVWCGWPDSAEHPWRFHRCRSWTSCSCTLLCLVRMARQRRTPVEIPQVPFMDKLLMHVVVSGADGQTEQNHRGDSTGAVLGQVVHARCCVWCGWPDSAEPLWRFHRCRSWTSCSCTLLCLVPMARQRRTPVEIPQVPFLDKLFMHVVVSGADVQTAQNPPWRFHRCRSWTSCSCTLLCLVRMSRQRRTPPWRFHRCRSWTSCSCTLLCLVRMSRQRRTTVEIPQVPFLDKLFMHVVVSGADVQTAQNHRGDSTGAVLGQVVHARCCVWCGWPDSAEPRGDSTGAVLGQVVHARCCVWCGWPNSAEPPWRFHRCRSWTSCSCTLLCLVRMARQRRTPVEIPQVPFMDKLFMHVVVSGADVQTAQNPRGDSTGAVLGQVVHARCCVWCRWPDSA